MEDLVEIDSLAVGDGGGQVLRSALSLSTILKKPVRIYNIRATRPNPGLQAQHIAGIEALAKLADAEVKGISKSSQEIVFKPKSIRSGSFEFDIGTAGAVTLVLQAVLPVLAFSKEKSKITVTGGTHVAWSPAIHYFQNVFLPVVSRMDYKVKCKIEKWGWYPKGGGRVIVETSPVRKLRDLSLVKRGSLIEIKGISCASNLPVHVAERQGRICKDLIRDMEVSVEVSEALSPGSAVTLWANYENCILGTSSLGKLGKRAEEVGKEAAQELLEIMRTDACLDKHLADQVLLYMSLAEGTSEILVGEVTEHIKTNMCVIQKFTGKEFKINGRVISIQGCGLVNLWQVS